MEINEKLVARLAKKIQNRQLTVRLEEELYEVLEPLIQKQITAHSKELEKLVAPAVAAAIQRMLPKLVEDFVKDATSSLHLSQEY